MIKRRLHQRLLNACHYIPFYYSAEYNLFCYLTLVFCVFLSMWYVYLTTSFVAGSKNLTLLVQNERDIELKVNISFGKSTDNNLSEFKIPGHGTEKV